MLAGGEGTIDSDIAMVATMDDPSPSVNIESIFIRILYTERRSIITQQHAAGLTGRYTVTGTSMVTFRTSLFMYSLLEREILCSL